MRLLQLAWLLLPAISAAAASSTTTPSTDGVAAFIKRRLPDHADSFEVSITKAAEASAATNDAYTVSTSRTNGKIQIQGTSLSAVMQG